MGLLLVAVGRILRPAAASGQEPLPPLARGTTPRYIKPSGTPSCTSEPDRREAAMPRVVRGGLIQAKLCEPATAPVAKIKQAMLEKHVGLIAEAARRGA